MSNSSFGLPWPGAGEQFLLRPDVAFLNHGSFGACPKPVFDTYQAWQRDLEAEPVEFLGRRSGGLLAEARKVLGTYVGADAEDLVFVTNATYGVNIVARSLDLRPGDEVLTTDHEYGACDRTWKFICGTRGARYVKMAIPLPLPSDEEIVERLWAGVNERTKVIYVSHITSPTAITLPVAEICRRAREAGILTVIDGAHAPGQVELNLEELGVDFYTGNLHKWLCAPKGSGFLYARRERQALLNPLIVSWGWESETPGPSQFIDHFTWLGTADPSAYLSVPAAIEFQSQWDWPKVREACHALAVEGRRRLEEVAGMPRLSPESNYVQMCAIELPTGTIERLGTRLFDEYKVEVPLTKWDNRQFLRISIQAYNRVEDVDRLVEALGRESRRS
jgi:isopenicillin-N epimerase